MANIDFIIALIIAIFLFVLGVVFVIQSFLMNRTAYALTTGVFVASFGSLVEAIYHLPKFETNRAILVASFAIWIVAYFLIFVFFVQLNKENINLPYTSVIVFIALFHLTAGLISLHPGLPDDLRNLLIFFWLFGYTFTGILVFAYGAVVHFDIYRRTKESAGWILGGAVTLIAVGFFIGMLIYFSALLENNDIIQKGFLKPTFPFHNVMQLIGILILMLFYLFNLQYIFRVPVNIAAIILFNSLGMPIYAAKYTTQNIEQSAEKSLPIDLITASINAFQTFMQQTTDSKEPLKRIATLDKKVIIESTDLVSVAVIADEITYFMLNSMKALVKAIQKDYREFLLKEFADSTYFKGVATYVSKYFPYLPLPTAEIA